MKKTVLILSVLLFASLLLNVLHVYQRVTTPRATIGLRPWISGSPLLSGTTNLKFIEIEVYKYRTGYGSLEFERSTGVVGTKNGKWTLTCLPQGTFVVYIVNPFTTSTTTYTRNIANLNDKILANETLIVTNEMASDSVANPAYCGHD